MGLQRTHVSEWQTAGGQTLRAEKFVETPDVTDADPRFALPALYAASRARKLRSVVRRANGRGRVLLFADLQVGKTDHRGGTAEFLQRMACVRAELDAELKANPVERILIADLGDGIEGFNSTASEMFTNDRSLPEQLDLYATELYEMVKVAARHAPVDVLVVPSNHASWRAGKQSLGRPSDDFGIYVHKQVEKLTQVAGLDVTFNYPGIFDETITVSFVGRRIGATHGHQAGPSSFPTWFAKQMSGGGPLADAEIVISGHYHSFMVQQLGRLTSGLARWWVQATCLDNGSSWWKNAGGMGDSDAGMTTFLVNRTAGFQLGSTDVLYGQDVEAVAA